MRAEPADEVEVCCAGQGRDLCAVGPSELDGGVADTARRAPDEESFAGAQPGFVRSAVIAMVATGSRPWPDGPGSAWRRCTGISRPGTPW